MEHFSFFYFCGKDVALNLNLQEVAWECQCYLSCKHPQLRYFSDFERR